jgi:hypothetical protein
VLDTMMRFRPAGVTLNSLKAAASAVSRVGAITVPSSLLGLPTRYTNQSSGAAGLPTSELLIVHIDAKPPNMQTILRLGRFDALANDLAASEEWPVLRR